MDTREAPSRHANQEAGRLTAMDRRTKIYIALFLLGANTVVLFFLIKLKFFGG